MPASRTRKLLRRKTSVKSNLFGLGGGGGGRGGTTYSSKLMKQAYDAGYRGKAGHRGEYQFDEWLKGIRKTEKDLSGGFVRQLRAEFGRGVKEEQKAHEAGHKARGKGVGGGRAVTFKGKRIVPVEGGGGEWMVPGIDSESRFESLGEAKRFVAANPRRQGRGRSRGPVESAYRGITEAPGQFLDTAGQVGRYLDKAVVGKVVGNPEQDRFMLYRRIMYRDKQESGTVSGKTVYVGGGTKISVLSKRGRRVLVTGDWDGAPFYGWVDDIEVATRGAYRKTHGAEPEGMRSGNPTPEVEAAYYAAVKADDEFQRALEKQLGGEAGRGERYQTKQFNAAAKAAYERKIAADERYRAVVQRMRKGNPAGDGRPWLKLGTDRSKHEAEKLVRKLKADDRKLRVLGSTGNYDAVEMRKTFEGPGGSRYTVFVVMKENPRRRNPESGSAAVYESFHGRPSTGTVVIEKDFHFHEHVGGLATCCGLIVDSPTVGRVVIGLSGYEWQGHIPRDYKWSPRRDGGFVKVDQKTEDVLLTSTENGKQLFLDGGDQKLDLATFKVAGAEKDKESYIVGDVAFIGYETEKEFDKFEPTQYIHGFSEDSKGTMPQLRYDIVNCQLHLDGGVYFIELPLMGTSPGIED